MASPSPSSSPRWDSAWENRNSGFISPSQLQLWRQQQQQQQQHQFQSQPDQAPPESQLPPPPAMYSSTSRPAPAPVPAPAPPQAQPPPSTSSQPSPTTPDAPPTHARTTSHFSFFGLKGKSNHTPQPSSASATTPRSPPAQADEFGHQPRPSATSIQSFPTQRAGNGAQPLAQGNEKPAVSPGRPGNEKQPPTPATPLRSPPAFPPPSPTIVTHPEIKSVVSLIVAQGRKIYFSGPLVQHDEREPDGARSKDDSWRDVWAQLGGTTLSLWDMKEIEEASKQGKQVPPKFVNIQDAFITVLGSVSIPPKEDGPMKKYTNVITLNTAGLGLKLFACPSTQSLLAWTAALRLAAWEKSRLEEIYTAHLLRITLQDAARAPTPLTNGHMEGWVKARIAGRTDWRSLWMVITAGLGGHSHDSGSVSSLEQQQQQKPTHLVKKKRLSALFGGGGRDHSPPRSPVFSKPTIQLFVSNKQKDMKKPVLTIREVTQAFAVYPERPDLIEQASLIKLEGSLGDEEAAGSMKNREGWMLIIPEPEGHRTPAVEMRKFLIGLHDAFGLYGRPRMYSWDPRDPRGMMFAYPIGEQKDQLFLDRELAENLDPRDDRTSANRSQLQHILWDRMRGSPDGSRSPPVDDKPPILPPLPDMTLRDDDLSKSIPISVPGDQTMQIPPLQFEKSRTDYELPEIPSISEGLTQRALTPITEGSDLQNSRSGDQYPSSFTQQKISPPLSAPNGSSPEHPQETGVLGGGISNSPRETSPALPSPQHEIDTQRRMSVDSFAMTSSSRPDSKLSHVPGVRQLTSPHSASPQSNSPQSASPQTTSPPSVSPPPQHQTFGANDARAASIDLGRQSPASYPATVQRPVPVKRPSAISMNRDASLPAIPQEVPQTPVRHGVELYDPPASPGKFSVLTSPHSPMNSPIAARASRHSLIQELVPSPRESVRTTTPSMSYPSSQPSSSQPSSPIEPPLHAPSPLRSPPPPVRVPSHPSVQPSSPVVSSPLHSPPVAQSPSALHPKVPSKSGSEEQDFLREAGALYYMRHMEQNPPGPRRPPPPPDDGGDETESDSSSSSYSPSPTGNNTDFGATSPLRITGSPNTASPPSKSPAMSPSSFAGMPPRGGTPVAFGPGSTKPAPAAPSPEKASAAVSPRMATAPVRKPSGARAVPASASKTVAQRELPHQQPHLPSDVDEGTEDDDDDQDDDMSDEQYDGDAPHGQQQLPPRMAAARAEDRDYNEHHADAVNALAALTFLEQEEEEPVSPPPPQQRQPIPPPPPIPEVVEPRATSPPAPTDSAPRSSFAPSKQASQRRAQAQAQQAATQAALAQPGKAGRKKVRDRGAWGDSSEEEEEEDDEEDDEEVDSDAEPPQREGRQMDPRMLGGGQPGYAASARGMSPGRAGPEAAGYPRQRRDLPQVPQQGHQIPGGSDESLGPRRSLYPDSPRRQASPQMARQPEPPAPGVGRQNNIWSTTLDREKAEPARDTFVQIEPPSQTMTKAFAPHGLLSAGLQDKADRSAKRQEELARESGSSLINVPNKPPPPQTGLLGAVTAHERERKRDGGLGATLTEREREKRLAEERQRKLDEFQRMQLEQMQQGGSVYGGMGMMPQLTGYNPMMANPMMMGMNPMMTGWGFPGMVNPQHMFAAQQAAQAYQQAMMAFSTAGSQVGGGEGGAAQPMNPMMTGGMMGGYDPRMSMMGMPMMTGMSGMNPSMTGMNPGMNMAQGMAPMGQGMAPGMGIGMQMTGGSAFDARFTPSNDGGLRPMGDANGSQTQLPYSSQNSSANGLGTPAGPRSQELADDQSKRAADDVR